jgi:hypothetical protein
MVTQKKLEIRNFMQLTRKLSMHSWGLSFLSIPNMFYHVLIKFPRGSQIAPQDVPNSTSILSHIVWPWLNFHVYKL